jgi:hypothetical protein
MLLTDTNDELQVNWLRAVQPGLDLEVEGEACPSGRRAAWVDARHPLLAGVAEVPAEMTHPRWASGLWQVLARCREGRPILMVAEVGDGLIVATSLSRQSGFPSLPFLQNLWLWARDSNRINAAREREEARYRALTEAKELGANRIDPPIIDGILEEGAWNRAAQTAQFVLPDNRAVADQETRALLGFDDYWLYLAFRCADSDPADLVMRAAPGDRSALEDDCVEALVDPAEPGVDPLRFVVTAGGVTYAEPGVSGWQAAVQRTPRGWSAELRVPLVALGDVEHLSGDWAVNFVRRYPRVGRTSAWAPGGDQARGRLKGVAVDPQRFPLRLNAIELVGGRLSASFTKPSYGDFRGRYLVECTSPSGKVRQTSREITVGEYDSTLVETEHRLDEPGTWTLRARVEAEGGPVWISEPLERVVPSRNALSP